MDKLIIFNVILIIGIPLGLWLIKKCVKKERTQNIILIAAAVFTIALHYSMLFLRMVTGGDAIAHLSYEPNLLLPIYPCNVVMWSAVIVAFLKMIPNRIS